METCKFPREQGMRRPHPLNIAALCVLLLASAEVDRGIALGICAEFVILAG